MNEIDLLTEYRQTRSEEAFAELVRRYANLVYSIAKRRLSNAALAEEVAQAVFARLAHAPPKLGSPAEVAAWLHRTTVHVAIDVWRSETRRRTREQSAALMPSAPAEKNLLWDEVAPMLDEALDGLAETDRQALLLRFFDRKAMRDVGEALGVSEDAAKMRVSRAVERLRSQLALRGVTCAAVALGTLLAERTVEAAPEELIAGLSAMRFPAHAPLGGAPGFLSALLLISKAKLAGGLVALAVIGIGTFVLVQSLSHSTPVVNAPQIQADGPESALSEPGAGGRPGIQRMRTPTVGTNAPAPEVVRLLFHVVDAETGEGLPNARIHMAYFYAGGRGEVHESVTDASGAAGIPEALEANAHGMNVFVSVEGHVPKVVNFKEEDARREYTMKLDRGVSIGGIVVDEQGQPVAGVKIRVQRSLDGRQPGDAGPGSNEHVDFQTCAVVSDANGRWLCTYIPKDYTQTRLILTRDDYAVTLPEVPANKANSTNLVLVLNRGFTVTGSVTDFQARPIPGAQIKELNNTGYRRQSTTTDERGIFTLKGTGDYDGYTSRLPEENPNGTLALRGLAPSGEPHVNLTVEAEGLGPEARTVRLLELTNIANFTLGKGNLFRGRILDEAGNPIPNAIVRTDSDNHGLTRFQWNTTADAEGRFAWTSAPAEPTLFWFEAPGYQVQRDVLLVADGTEHEIRLKR